MDGYQRISHYKAHMMGLAVMIVVYGHLLYYHGNLIDYDLNHWTEWYTLGSVEMFIFLSGFGIYQSLRRNRDAYRFYGKRLARLAPSYLPVMAVWCGWNMLKGRMSLPQTVGNLSALGYWFQLDNQFNWYVPATLILYLLSPLMFDFIEKKRVPWMFVILAVVNLSAWRSNLLMSLSRFPTYFLGMYMGSRYAKGISPSKKEIWISVGVGAVAMAAVPYFFLEAKRTLWYYGMYWYPFMFAAPLWMFGISKAMELNDRFALGRGVNKVWAFLGARSFEIYLCHLALYDTMLKHGVQGWLKWICIAVAGTCIGIAFHEVVDRCTKWWKERKQTAAA